MRLKNEGFEWGKMHFFGMFILKQIKFTYKILILFKKKVEKSNSYLLKFGAEFRLSLEASRSLRSHSVTEFSMNLKILNLFLSLLKKELGAVRPVSSLFLRLSLVGLS